MSGRLHQMLAVVEDQQQLFAFERSREILDEIAFGGKPDAERRRDRRGNVLALTEWREFNEPHAVANLVNEIGRHV